HASPTWTICIMMRTTNASTFLADRGLSMSSSRKMLITMIGWPEFIINTANKEHLGDIRVDSINVQAMAVEPGTGPKKMYADLADKNQIAVIDLEKRTVLTSWPTTPECQGPFAAAVDSSHHRLFVGCRMYATQP